MRIVVIEDEIRIREGIAKLLKKLNKGYEVVGEAENGEEGLELLRNLRPDIVITDIKMPIMDGLEMLKAAYKEGIPSKAVVLSAYSEFEYARQAMKLGVTEYLLKPLTLNMFSQALENVCFQVKEEQAKKPDQIGTKEQIFRGLLNGNLTAEKEVINYLENKFYIQAGNPFIVFCTYLGSRYQEDLTKTKKALKHIWSLKPEVSCCMLESEYRKSIIMVLYNFPNAHSLERWLQYQILNDRLSDAVFGWWEAETVFDLNKCFEQLYPYMDWNIALDQEVLVSYPKVTCVQTVPCIYPIELENQMKTAVCMYDWKKVRKLVEDFHMYFKNGKIYEPKEIKGCYVRFLWALIGISKEISCLDYKTLNQERILELIMGAKTKQELKSATEELVSQLRRPVEMDEDITHLTVKRAKGMIHEFYQTGITLEEISNKLDITPEYLGTQFHKEVGVNFSTYIRSCRMNKAKELLCGTQLKLYEISERVGYSNPKYFSQVFKEYTGQLPAEYRKTHK